MVEKTLTESNFLGPEIIVSDPDLEQSLLLNISEDYYIGFLNEDGDLPVRHPPGRDNLKGGWDDKGYELDSVSVGIEFGTPIELVEIVHSATGIWVGFLYESSPDEVLYTESKYIRIKESAIKARPTPLVSSKILLKPESQENIQRILLQVGIY